MRPVTHLSDYSPPGGREPPGEVVLGLREIDPLAELVYVGKGRWLLGKVSDEWDKRQTAINAMTQWKKLMTKFDPANHEEPLIEILPGLFDRWNEKRLQVMGFQPLPVVFHMEMPDSGIVEFFRRVDWIWKFAWKEASEEKEAEADGSKDQEARQKELVDRFNQVYKAAWRHVFKRPTQRTTTVDIAPDGAIRRTA